MSGVDATRTRPAAPARAAVSAEGVRRLFLAAAWIEPRAATLESVEASLDDGDLWASAARLAQRVNQEPLFLHFARRHAPAAPLATELRGELEAQSRFHAFRWDAIRETVVWLLEAMARRGILPVLLKGISHAGENYVPAHLRPMRDADLLIGENELAGAQEAAGECGFAPDPDGHPEKEYEGHHHAPPLFHRSTDVCLELHHALVRPTDRLEGFPPVTAFRQTARPSRVFPGLALVLEPAHEVLNTCAHITHGDSIGRRAQNLIDLARTIEREEAGIDWAQLESYAGAPDVARSLFVPLGYLAREGLSTAPCDVLSRLHAASKLSGRELELLWGLVDRYRIGSPGAWPLVSGRISNILWREALRRSSLPRKVLRVAIETVAGRWKRR